MGTKKITKHEQFTLEGLKPYEKNAKIHTQTQIEHIAASIKLFGWQQPIVADEGGVILIGHGRFMAAKSLGYTVGPVWINEGLTDAEKAALRVADNKIAAETTFNEELLQLELDQILKSGIELADLGIGLDFTETFNENTSQKSRVSSMEDYFDETEEAKIAIPVEQGDVFKLNGTHTIICGDSTKRDTYERLLGDKRAELLFTDPPYGVAYQGAGAKGAILGDLSQVAIPLSFKHITEFALDEHARVYLCGGSSNVQMYYSLFDNYLRMMPRLIVWAKESFVLRPYNYHSQYELVFFGWRGTGGGEDHWYGDRKQSDIWQIKRDSSRDYIHPTQKPVELPARAIMNSCSQGGIVLEPFLGSGSTLIAAHGLGRVCFGIELDPHFIRKILKRFHAFCLSKDQPCEIIRNGDTLDLAPFRESLPPPAHSSASAAE